MHGQSASAQQLITRSLVAMTARSLLSSLIPALLVLLAVTARADSTPDVLALAKEMFPTADRIGEFSGKPPAAAVQLKGQELGYVFFTEEVMPIPAYSGKPINCLVGFDLRGRIKGVRIVHHEEPILVVGLSDKDLARFTAQYRELPITDDIRIGGQQKPGRSVIDGISGATITTMVINSTISQGVKKVAAARELLTKEDGGSFSFEEPEPLWEQLWNARVPSIIILSTGLLLLLSILMFQDWLARHPTLLSQVRTVYLVFTVVFIGWLAAGQLSIVNVLTFTNSLLHGFSWESFLIDPMLFMLWSFVAFTVLLWGRGVYCGWLCPFGALQELLFRIARRMKLPEWEPPEILHERLTALKYLLLLALFGLSLQSLSSAERYAEVEPFKTAFSMHFWRDWPFVVYALALLGLGLVVRKAYCRYLCPLGAALTFPTRFRIFDWLRRRKECGRPCQICAQECEVRAIRPTGEIIDNECHHCLDCQVTYWDDKKCPPLVEKRKKRERAAKLSEHRVQE
jgi:Na+-translocating ferredoxin:NAD+ oxidoreductase RnfG subunit